MAYRFSKSVTVDNTKVSGSGNLSNFPVLVSGTYTELKTTANGGRIQKTDATGGADGATTVPADFVFSPNTDGTSPYDFEIENYNASTGEIQAWVEITTLDFNDDTVFYMVYGDSAVTTSQEDVNGTWDTNYIGVWHLNNHFKDSTSHAHDGTNDGTNDRDGVIAQGRDFATADTDNIDLGTAIADALDGTSKLTVSAWVKNDDLPGTDLGRFIFGSRVHSNAGVDLWINDDSDSDFLTMAGRSVTTDSYQSATFAYSTTGSNLYVVGTMDFGGDNIKLYTDGTNRADTSVTFGNNTYTLGTPGDNDTIGATPNHASLAWGFQGLIDEVRISTDERSADWIKTEYNNQNSPSTFYSVGDQVDSQAGVPNQRVGRGLNISGLSL